MKHKRGQMGGNISALIGVVVAILVVGLISAYAAKINFDFKEQSCEDRGYFWNATAGQCHTAQSAIGYEVNDSVSYNVSDSSQNASGTVGTNLSLIMTIAVVAIIISLLIGAFAFSNKR